MPETVAPDVDPVRAFAMAVPYRLREQLRLDYETWPVIRAAAANIGSPTELAKTVAHGITRQHANPWPLMWHRIRRAAGLLDTDDNHEEATT